MFDVIATAKNTQWLSFPTLYKNYSYSHVENEAVDFQVIPGKNGFVEFNKKFGFELLRTINHENKNIIQRIKKRQVDNISCGSVSKSNGSEIAVGTTTGYVRLFNLQTAEYLPIKFKPDRIGNSVIALDFSYTDEYLAAVYDSSDIKLFGLKTGIKTDQFKFNGVSTLVRFHPSRKFALAIGSFEGAIRMLDIQTKKNLFYEKTAHEAPVRDISMYESSQDIIVSCGYDCAINIYDIRKRATIQKYKQPHPMSTICVSPCATFCVAGNLKGDVISYDFRNMKEPLDTRRVHDTGVVRVAFIPSITNATNITLDQMNNVSQIEDTTNSSIYVSATQTTNRDSFARFVDMCHYNNVASVEFATPKRNDSWSDLMATKKSHDMSLDAMETPSLMTRLELRLKRNSRLSLEQSTINSAVSQLEASPMPTNFDVSISSGTVQDIKQDQQTSSNLKSTVVPMTISEKENTETNLQNIQAECDMHNDKVMAVRKRRSTFHESFSMNIKTNNTSSPTESETNQKNTRSCSIGKRQNLFCRSSTMPEKYLSSPANDVRYKNAINGTDVPALTNETDAHKMLSEMIDQSLNITRQRIGARFESATSKMLAHIEEHSNQTYNTMYKILEHFYEQGLQGGWNLMSRLPGRCEDISEALDELIQTDQFSSEYFRLKYAVNELKEKLGIREPNFRDHLY